MHIKQNEIHYIILLVIVAKVITSLRKEYNMKWEFQNKIVKPANLTDVVVLVLTCYYVLYHATTISHIIC